jgi:hypothetical protein
MRQQASDFAIEDADELRAPRDRDAQKLFRCQAERMLLVHRRDIVEAVESQAAKTKCSWNDRFPTGGSAPAGPALGSSIQVRPARSIFSNALNLRCSAIAAFVRSP